jgi:hypothetical protein
LEWLTGVVRREDAVVERFVDRLRTATYEHDVLTGVFADDPDQEVWMPERLFDRLVYVAKGYELHVLSNLQVDDTVLSRPLIEAFVDEVTFVAERLDDNVLIPWLQRLVDHAGATAFSHRDQVDHFVELIGLECPCVPFCRRSPAAACSRLQRVMGRSWWDDPVDEVAPSQGACEQACAFRCRGAWRKGLASADEGLAGSRG